MNNEELIKTIDVLQDVMTDLGDINMSAEMKRERTFYQNKLNKAFDKIYSLKKHLEFILNVGG